MQAGTRIRCLSVDSTFRKSKDINPGAALGAFCDPGAAQRAAWSEALWLCRLSASAARVASRSYLAAISSMIVRAWVTHPIGGGHGLSGKVEPCGGTLEGRHGSVLTGCRGIASLPSL
jgi:hypothetical protein